QSAVELIARGTDAVGLSDGLYPMFHEMFTKGNAIYMGNSKHAKYGDVVGQMAGTLPVGGIRAVAALPQLAKAGPVARFGARLLDAGVQGGTAAALTSSASDAPLGEQI